MLLLYSKTLRQWIYDANWTEKCVSHMLLPFQSNYELRNKSCHEWITKENFISFIYLLCKISCEIHIKLRRQNWIFFIYKMLDLCKKILKFAYNLGFKFIAFKHAQNATFQKGGINFSLLFGECTLVV